MRLIGDVLRELFVGCIIHGMVINPNDLIADLREGITNQLALLVVSPLSLRSLSHLQPLDICFTSALHMRDKETRAVLTAPADRKAKEGRLRGAPN